MTALSTMPLCAVSLCTKMTDRISRGRSKPMAQAGEIGPNAVIQLVAALKAAGLQGRLAPVFGNAGVAAWLDEPPSVMVDSRSVGELHQAIRASMPKDRAAALMADAGRRTADYLLGARIPRPVRVVLKLLPPRLAAMVLVAAIRAHAWTFAGTGRFTASVGSSSVLRIAGNPLCAGETAAAPVCHWHVAVFQRLFEVLVSPAARVAETACEACGDNSCRFEVRWNSACARTPSSAFGPSPMRSRLLRRQSGQPHQKADT
jgi:divinyl protochlorophyllide a 8-vinyl-reductase